MPDTPNIKELVERLKDAAEHLGRYDPPILPRNPFTQVCSRAADALEAQAAELARVRAERDTYKWHWEQASKQPEWNVPEPMTLLSDSDLLAVLQGWREFDKPEEFQGISYGAMRSALAAYHKALIAAAPPPPAQPAPPNRCKLIQCRSKPRCAMCLEMDAAYPQPAPPSAVERDAS